VTICGGHFESAADQSASGAQFISASKKNKSGNYEKFSEISGTGEEQTNGN
jgi:hypothetical protein